MQFFWKPEGIRGDEAAHTERGLLGRDEDIAVRRADLGPLCWLRLTVLPHDGRHRLVEEWHV